MNAFCTVPLPLWYMYIFLYHVDEGSALHGIRNCTANKEDLYM